jgi:hypothetical protein
MGASLSAFFTPALSLATGCALAAGAMTSAVYCDSDVRILVARCLGEQAVWACQHSAALDDACEPSCVGPTTAGARILFSSTV